MISTMSHDPHSLRHQAQRSAVDADKAEFLAFANGSTSVDAGIYDWRLAGVLDDFEPRGKLGYRGLAKGRSEVRRCRRKHARRDRAACSYNGSRLPALNWREELSPMFRTRVSFMSFCSQFVMRSHLQKGDTPNFRECLNACPLGWLRCFSVKTHSLFIRAGRGTQMWAFRLKRQ